MVSSATKRRRQKRANETAAAIEESKRDASIEKKLLGVQVDSKAPDTSLFQLDRGGENKAALKQKTSKDAHAEKLLLRRARRGDSASRALVKSKVRKSERFASKNDEGQSMDGLTYPEGSLKKSRGIGIVEKTILKKRTFDPDIHREKKKKDMERVKNKPGTHDIWMSDIKKEVDEKITDSRKNFVKNTRRRHRRAKAVIFPDAGSSINPSYEHHQDKLGVALAKIVAEEERERIIDQKLSFDPEMFKNESNIDSETGMKIDANDESTNAKNDDGENGDDDDDGGDDDNNDNNDIIAKSVPERKTKSQRNKERRKRELESAIAKKRRNEKQAADFDKLEELVEEAQEEADKVNGVTKRELRKQHVPVPNRNRHRPVFFKIAGQRVRKESDNEHVALSDELADNLRSVKVAPNNPLLKDRLLSFERRGMVESNKVLTKETWRVRQEQKQDELRDKTKRKGKHSRSDISYWKEKSRKK